MFVRSERPASVEHTGLREAGAGGPRAQRRLPLPPAAPAPRRWQCSTLSACHRVRAQPASNAGAEQAAELGNSSPSLAEERRGSTSSVPSGAMRGIDTPRWGFAGDVDSLLTLHKAEGRNIGTKEKKIPNISFSSLS